MRCIRHCKSDSTILETDIVRVILYIVSDIIKSDSTIPDPDIVRVILYIVSDIVREIPLSWIQSDSGYIVS